MALWVEMRIEEILRHRWRHSVAPAWRQCHQNYRRVQMTQMIGRKDHRSIELLQMLESADLDPRKHASQGQNPDRKTRAASGTCPQAAVPRGKRHHL